MIQSPLSQHVAMGDKMKSSCQSVHLPTTVDVDKKWMSRLASVHLRNLRNSIEDMIHFYHPVNSEEDLVELPHSALASVFGVCQEQTSSHALAIT